MKPTKIMALAVLSLVASLAMAAKPAPSKEEDVKKLLQSRLPEGAKVESLIKTPYMGLYEAKVGGGLLYTDEKVQYIFDGQVLDATSHKNLTQARMDELNKIKFADLPFDSAVKVVKGNGKRAIAIFEDPNCGYCKRFRQSLKEVDNITVYTFMYNILSEDSVVKSKNVWCSADRAKAWEDWMLDGKAPATAAASCTTTPNEKIKELGRKYNINGTPAIFFVDGTRVPGAINAKQLEEKLASLK